MSWQMIGVILIVVGAFAFLISRFWGSERGPRASNRPDVKVSSLVRKKKPPRCH